MNDERIGKIPAWARRLIVRLRLIAEQVNATERLNADLGCFFGNSETNVSILSIYSNYGLPKNSNIEFKLNNNNIICKIMDGELRIYGDAAINITPMASNSIYIK